MLMTELHMTVCQCQRRGD